MKIPATVTATNMSSTTRVVRCRGVAVSESIAFMNLLLVCSKATCNLWRLGGSGDAAPVLVCPRVMDEVCAWAGRSSPPGSSAGAGAGVAVGVGVGVGVAVGVGVGVDVGTGVGVSLGVAAGVSTLLDSSSSGSVPVFCG